MGEWSKMEIEFYCLDTYQGLIPDPSPAYKEIPSWYKETTNISQGKRCPFAATNLNKIGVQHNIKSCPAVFDYLSGGYIIKAWDNFLIRNVDGGLYVNWENPCMHYEDVNGIFQTHTTEQQIDGLLNKNTPLYGGFHKILSPWFVKTPPGVSLYITNPSQYRDKRFTTIDGVIHPEQQSISLQWFFEWNIELPMNISMDSLNPDINIIKKGTPLMMVFPFKRDNYKFKVNYISDKKYKNHRDKTLWYTHDWFGNSLYNQFRRKLGRLFT